MQVIFHSHSSEGPFGPVCEKCKCHGHKDVCHPKTGECISLECIEGDCGECYEGEEGCGPPQKCEGDVCRPDPDSQTWECIDPEVCCHHRPDRCEEKDLDPDASVNSYS